MVYHIAEYFQARGVVFFGSHQDTPIFLIPEELRRKIKALLNKKRVQKQIKINNDYIKYAVGSAIYYGVLTPDLLYKSLARYMEIKERVDPLDVLLEYSRYTVVAYSIGPFFITTAVEDMREILIFNFSLLIKNNISTSEIIRILAESYEIDVFEGKDELIKLINDFHNNTRQWVLKGYTPAEVYSKNK